MRKILIVVDMQNDFIDAALGTEEAVSIVDAVKEKIRSYPVSDVIATMDTHGEDYMQSQEGKYLPVRRKADGSLSGGDSLATPEEFGELETRLTDTVCKITGELRGGNADAVPLSRTRPDLDKDPCGYCPMKPICRAEYAKEGRDSRA